MRNTARTLLIGGMWLGSTLFAGVAWGQEASPAGDPCAGFKWPLKREQTWLSSPGLRRIAPGDTLPQDMPAAVLGLKRSDAADLPHPASREPKPGTYAGTLLVPALMTAGIYQITLSDEGWIDVFQQDEAKTPIAHTGKQGCIGMRKSLRFQLDSKPVLIQITNARAETVRIAIAPVEE